MLRRNLDLSQLSLDTRLLKKNELVRDTKGRRYIVADYKESNSIILLYSKHGFVERFISDIYNTEQDTLFLLFCIRNKEEMLRKDEYKETIREIYRVPIYDRVLYTYNNRLITIIETDEYRSILPDRKNEYDTGDVAYNNGSTGYSVTYENSWYSKTATHSIFVEPTYVVVGRTTYAVVIATGKVLLLTENDLSYLQKVTPKENKKCIKIKRVPSEKK